MKTLSVSHLLGIKYLNEEDLHLIFANKKELNILEINSIKKPFFSVL